MAGEINAAQLMLSSRELAEVQKILRDNIPGYAVWAFGSRVLGEAGPYSDLDLAIITKEPLTLSTMADLKEAFTESDLVFKVDIVDWAVTGNSFRRIIESGKVVLQNGTNERR